MSETGMPQGTVETCMGPASLCVTSVVGGLYKCFGLALGTSRAVYLSHLAVVIVVAVVIVDNTKPRHPCSVAPRPLVVSALVSEEKQQHKHKPRTATTTIEMFYFLHQNET